MGGDEITRTGTFEIPTRLTWRPCETSVPGARTRWLLADCIPGWIRPTKVTQPHIVNIREMHRKLNGHAITQLSTTDRAVEYSPAAPWGLREGKGQSLSLHQSRSSNAPYSTSPLSRRPPCKHPHFSSPPLTVFSRKPSQLSTHTATDCSSDTLQHICNWFRCEPL